MKAPTAAIARLLLMSVFVAIVGLLGGRIGAAAWIYKELGWTAMWLEVSGWGPSLKPEPVGARSYRGSA